MPTLANPEGKLHDGITRQAHDNPYFGIPKQASYRHNKASFMLASQYKPHYGITKLSSCWHISPHVGITSHVSSWHHKTSMMFSSHSKPQFGITLQVLSWHHKASLVGIPKKASCWHYRQASYWQYKTSFMLAA